MRAAEMDHHPEWFNVCVIFPPLQPCLPTALVPPPPPLTFGLVAAVTTTIVTVLLYSLDTAKCVLS